MLEIERNRDLAEARLGASRESMKAVGDTMKKLKTSEEKSMKEKGCWWCYKTAATSLAMHSRLPTNVNENKLVKMNPKKFTSINF